MTPAELQALVQTFDDGEPCIRDIDLAIALAYPNPAQIREVINANLAALEQIGFIRRRRIITGERGRPATEFLLTERQAYLYCKFSKQPKALDVCIALVEAFYQYRHGGLVVAGDSRETRILGIQRAEVEQMILPLITQMTHLDSKVEIIATTVVRVESKIDSLHAKTDFGNEYLKEIWENSNHKRQEISKADRLTHLEYLQSRGGKCPLCCEIQLLEHGLASRVLEFDHWFGRHRANLFEVWPVCKPCNRRLENDPDYKLSRTTAFQEYSYGLHKHIHPLLLGVPTL